MAEIYAKNKPPRWQRVLLAVACLTGALCLVAVLASAVMGGTADYADILRGAAAGFVAGTVGGFLYTAGLRRKTQAREGIQQRF